MDYVEALNYYKKCLELEPDDPESTIRSEELIAG